MRARRKMLGTDQARRWRHRGGAVAVEAPRPHVLVEEPDGAEAFALWRLLEDNGYDVAWCPGPEDTPQRQCPLVATGRCELVQHADVVVSSLGLHHDSCRQVLGAIRRLHPATPVIVEAARPSSERWAPLLEGNRVLRTPVTGQAVLDSVHDVLSDGAHEVAGGPA